MKKLLTISLMLAVTVSYSQIELREHGKSTLINGATITINDWKGTDNTKDVPAEIDAKSTYSSSKTIKVKKIELSSTATTSKNAICWGSCSAQELWNNSPTLLSDPIAMSGNQVVLFSGHVYPFLTSGITKFRYVWFDVANPTDSAWVDVIFDISNVQSLAKIERENVSMKLFPNPASAVLNVDITLNQQNNSSKKIVITDLIGKVVYTKEIKNKIVNTKINTSDFNAGLYFVSFLTDGKAIKTEKVIITK